MSKLKEKKPGFLKLQLRERARQRSPRSATRKRSGTCGFFVVCWWQQMGHKTFRSLVHHCFWETSNYPKKGFTMAVSLPYLPADPKRIYAINYENKSCLKRGPYCHLIPGDPEQLVSLFLLSFFLNPWLLSWQLPWHSNDVFWYPERSCFLEDLVTILAKMALYRGHICANPYPLLCPLSSLPPHPTPRGDTGLLLTGLGSGGWTISKLYEASSMQYGIVLWNSGRWVRR